MSGSNFKIETEDAVDGEEVEIIVQGQTFAGLVVDNSASIVVPKGSITGSSATALAELLASGSTREVNLTEAAAGITWSINQAGQTLESATPLISWTESATLPAGVVWRYDLYVDIRDGNGFVDQGPSSDGLSWLWASGKSLPTDGREIDLRIYRFEDGTTPPADDDGLTDIPYAEATVTAATLSALAQIIVPNTTSNNISDPDYTALITPPATRKYVIGENELSIVQSSGQSWLQVDNHPTSDGSNHIGAFHDVGGIDSSRPIIVEQEVEFDDNWTYGNEFIVQKLGFGVQGRATDDRYVVGGSENPTGFSARFEVYGPNGPDNQFSEDDPNIGGYIYFVNWKTWNNSSHLARHVQTNVRVIPGQRYHMIETITPNTPGNADGSYSITARRIVNGSVVDTDTGTRNNIQWMTGTFRADGLSMDVFFGGDDSRYSPQGTATTRFREIKLRQ